MTVPQHRLVVKEPTDRVGQSEEGGEGKKNHTQTEVQSNAGGTHLRQALALSREELWQQEGRMPHCLKEGVLFLISIPRVLSPGRNKALAPH